MPKIVVCDDEPHIVHGLRYLLEADGHDVRVANNGIEALELIAQDPRQAVAVLGVLLHVEGGGCREVGLARRAGPRVFAASEHDQDSEQSHPGMLPGAANRTVGAGHQSSVISFSR